MSSWCLECGEEGDDPPIHEDPRSPPLDVSPCLCQECYLGIIEGLLEQAEADAAYYAGILST